MKKYILLFSLLLLSVFSYTQNTDSIYAFMNKDLPPLKINRSTWGMFFMNTPYLIDSSFCEKLKYHSWTSAPKKIQSEFYNKCLNMVNSEWQKQFRWKQSGLNAVIVVNSTAKKLSPTIVSQLKISAARKKEATKWIAEWNKTKVAERLINYSSIPIFSDNGQYVLILRGQDVRSEGGWDSIFIYQKTSNGWTMLEEIIVAEI